jgi:hypothetical protein
LLARYAQPRPAGRENSKLGRRPQQLGDQGSRRKQLLEVVHDQQRLLELARPEIGEMGTPAVVALSRPGNQADEDLLALGCDAPGAQDRLALGRRVVPEEAGVAEEVVELVLREPPRLPDLELADQHLANNPPKLARPFSSPMSFLRGK